MRPRQGRPAIATGALGTRRSLPMIIGLGIDIVDVDDFRSRLDDALMEEVFLPDEAGYALSMARPWEHFAARLAAKEAAFRALGSGRHDGLRWRDVEVLRASSGAVGLALHGTAGELALSRGVDVCHVSLAHTRSAAVAVVVMERGGETRAESPSGRAAPDGETTDD